MLTGRIVQYYYMSENSKNTLGPLFEFQIDQDYHLSGGMRPDPRVKEKNTEHFLNEQHSIYYAPDLTVNVSYGENEEFIRYKKRKIVINAMFLTISIGMIVIGILLDFI